MLKKIRHFSFISKKLCFFPFSRITAEKNNEKGEEAYKRKFLRKYEKQDKEEVDWSNVTLKLECTDSPIKAVG